MERIIKFKALKDDISNCNFVYGSLIYEEDGTPRIQTNKGGFLFVSCLKGTECQFTGLKDKNGVEIYEGDICETVGLNSGEKHKGVVYYIDREFVCCEIDKPFEEDLFNLRPEFIKIIGNIYQS